MAKKKTEIQQETPVPASEEASLATVTEEPPVARNGEEKKKPAVSYKLRLGSSTVEVAVWPNTIRSQFAGGGEVTVYSVTIGRSYKDDNEGWKQGGGYRTHELPGLLHLLQKASDWIYATRVEDSSAPF